MANSHKIGLGVLVAAMTISAQGQNPFDTHKQFSATIVMSGMQTGAPASAQGGMKIYRDGDKMRTSMPGGMGYMVMDLAQHTNYMVMGTGMCMQMSATRQTNPFAETQNASIDRSPAGTDTVDGHSCKVENVTVTAPNGKASKMKVWEADDLKGFPVKVEVETSKGPMTIQYKDISFDAPPASMFTHPDNCQQMGAMPGGPH